MRGSASAGNPRPDSADSRQVGLEGGLAHVEALGEREHVPLAASSEVTQQGHEPPARSVDPHLLRRLGRPQPPVHLLVETVAALIGDDDRAVETLVEGGHVIADRSRRHPDLLGQGAGSHRHLAPPQCVDQVRLPCFPI